MKITIIVGSLRKGSLNLQLAKIIQKALAGQAETQIFSDLNIPLFNQDIEFPTPASIQSIRNLFLESDGIWFVSPEYNGQIPGVLKNLMDWMSRPLVQGAVWSDTAMYGKCATVSGIGGNKGTSGMQALLIKLMKFGQMKVMEEPLSQIKMDPESMKTSDISYTKGIEATVQKQADAFVAFIKQNQ